MAEAGAELLLVPSATDTPRGHARVRIGTRARALENQCVVVRAATIGAADWLSAATRNTGAAAVYGPPDTGFPENGVIAEGKPAAPGWDFADVELDAVRQLRSEGTVTPFADWPEQAPAAVETVVLGAELVEG
jgi:predicted amidohydrolase